MTELDSLDTLLRRRHSCRGFLPDAVPDEVIARIVETAGRAPSWCNSQPWQVIVTRPAETDILRDKLLAGMGSPEGGRPDLPFPSAYTGQHQERRRTCGWQLYDAVGVTKGDRAGSAKQAAENFRLFGAPHTAILTSGTELGPYGAMDCGGFILAFCLAAEAAGVGCIPQAAVASMAPMLHDHFAIPEDRMVLCALTFGYEDTSHPANGFRTDRAPLADILDMRG
ncbi:nitroreductase [Oceanicola sp. 22II-s10i]|uniref:nitroreductase n=1 Tax=Oceanicola sp. 22II-s10i TaxID=1317116 RepID=UPI000B521827|nr:nitroreductase [Oceanicola sp. 22II-s10i]OWU86832.1 nitroreductase [Oceanicola sp. 22II-s10i]